MKPKIFDLVAPIYPFFERLLFSGTRDKMIEEMDLSKVDKVLDVGGGTGMLLEMILKERSDVDVYLLDESKEMMQKAPFSHNKIRGKACRTPFISDSFDLVLCVDALHHFEKKAGSLKEMIRVLRSEGEILILELDPRSPLTNFIEFGEKLVGEPSYFFEPEVLEEFFSSRDFQTSIKKLHPYDYILQAKKSE
ncbi:MAG: class I SAM-dependent methyltransferase [Thermoplasmatota archaeon]